MEEKSQEIMFQAKDITCSSCAGDMENILRETEGIIEASVNFTQETIYIKYNPQKLDRKKVFFAVRKLGYKIKII
jgi:copper chaperone CopZ